MRPTREDALASLHALRTEMLTRQAARERLRRQGRKCPSGDHRWTGWLLVRAETGAVFETRRCTRCSAAEMEPLVEAEA